MVEFTDITQLAKKYEAFLIDLWGVVHDGIKLYPGVLDCLNYLIALNKVILFLSNTPRPASVILNKLVSLGIPATTAMILSSGDMVREQLIYFRDPTFNNIGRRFYHLGADRNEDILQGISADVTDDIEDADFILFSAYLDEGDDLTRHDDLLKRAAALKLPLICANPDKEIINGKKIRYCAGLFAEKYENFGGIVYYYGKPHLAIYEVAFKRLQEKGIYHRAQILMIGDTLETDIKGAKNAEIDSALVLTGNMELLLQTAKIEDPELSLEQFLSKLFNKADITPTWIVPSLSL